MLSFLCTLNHFLGSHHCLYSLRVHPFKCETLGPLTNAAPRISIASEYGPSSYKHKNVPYLRYGLFSAKDADSFMQAAQFVTLDLFFTKLFRITQFSLIMHWHDLLVKMVAHQRGTLKWTTCGCQTLTFPYFIVFTLWNRHRCHAQAHSVTVLPVPLHSPVF